MTCKDCIHSGVCWLERQNEGSLEDVGEHYQCSDYLSEKKIVELPCGLGDKVYIITTCGELPKYHDNDYINGTGAVECPFEIKCECEFDECVDDRRLVVETELEGFRFDNYGDGLSLILEVGNGLEIWKTVDDFDKTAFFEKEAAERALKRGGNK